ncbi:MAG: hypothetical protein ACP5DQ_12260 [Bacteroidales bacterium]
MELIGSHDNGLVEDNLDCKIIIEKGILGVYAHSNTNYQKLNQPKNDNEWGFRKINWKENKPVVLLNKDLKNPKFKWKYSHVIEYKINDNDVQRIFINPSRWQKFLLNKDRGQLLYQKFTAIEYLIATVIAILVNVGSSFIYDSIRQNNQSNPNIAVQKTKSEKTPQSITNKFIGESKIDSLPSFPNDSLITK